jgi:hypothetical protein
MTTLSSATTRLGNEILCVAGVVYDEANDLVLNIPVYNEDVALAAQPKLLLAIATNAIKPGAAYGVSPADVVVWRFPRPVCRRRVARTALV